MRVSVRIVLVALAVAFLASFVREAPCISTDWSDTKVRSAAMCYSDVPYLYTGRGFAEQTWPFSAGDRYQRMEYPVGVSYLAWGASWLTKAIGAGPSSADRAAVSPDAVWSLPGMSTEVNQYFVITVLLLFGLALAAAWFLTTADPKRRDIGLMFAFSPALLSTAFINWDLLAVVCVAGAIWAWARERPILTGVLIGLGTAAKLYPLVLLGAVVVVLLRERAPVIRRTALVTGSAIAAWVIAQLPAWLTGTWSSWTYFWIFNTNRGADLGSLWLIAQDRGHPVATSTINVSIWLLLIVACLAILGVGLLAPRKPTFAQVGFLIVLAFTIVNKVYSPQYVLWLLPLAIMARPRWRDLLIWQACEFVYFVSVWWYIGGFMGGFPGWFTPYYDFTILVRVAGELFLAAMVIRELWLVDDHPVEGGRGVPDPGADLIADLGDLGAARQEQH